jgi:hypothetical protein
LKLFDPIRQKWVEETPEEKVRQALIKKMIKELGFKKSLLSVEKKLDLLPNSSFQPSNRRLDILAYAKGTKGLFPLLVIECKAIALNSEVIKQVSGYNHFIGARFMGVVNQDSFKLFWKKKDNQLEFVDFLPTYDELISTLKTS